MELIVPLNDVAETVMMLPISFPFPGHKGRPAFPTVHEVMLDPVMSFGQ